MVEHLMYKVRGSRGAMSGGSGSNPVQARYVRALSILISPKSRFLNT